MRAPIPPDRVPGAEPSGASRRRRGLAAALALAGAGVAGAVTARRLAAMREAARSVPVLEHDLELEGTGATRRVVVLGDSAAAGFGLPGPEQAIARRIGRALALRDGRPTSVRCVARNGATSADVLAQQVGAAEGADVVVVGLGANDAIKRRPLPEVAADHAALIERLRELAPEARLVLLGCPDLSAAPGLPALVRPLVGWRCRAVARVQADVARRTGVPLAPIPRADLTPETFGDDGFHPGVLGHERMAAAALALL